MEREESHAISYSCDATPLMGWNPRDGDGGDGSNVKYLPYVHMLKHVVLSWHCSWGRL